MQGDNRQYKPLLAVLAVRLVRHKISVLELVCEFGQRVLNQEIRVEIHATVKRNERRANQV